MDLTLTRGIQKSEAACVTGILLVGKQIVMYGGGGYEAGASQFGGGGFVARYTMLLRV